MDSLPLLVRRAQEPFIAKIPGSKSFTNRALVIAAHRVGTTVIHNALICDDTVRLANALNAFGGLSVQQGEGTFTVQRTAQRLTAPAEPVNLGAAGTPVRLMLAFSSVAEGETIVTGGERLCQRPMKDILDAFDGAGIQYTCLEKPGFLPVRVTGAAATSNNWQVSGEISSQFLTSLLIHASQQFQFAKVSVAVTGHLVSRPYVNMTMAMMREVGLEVREVEPNRFEVIPGSPASSDIQVEVDASGMSYLLAAAALTRTTVKIPGITKSSAQGDVGLVTIFEAMGCSVVEHEDSLELTGAPLRGIDVDMESMPDVVLSLAVVATQADSAVTVRNIANLRVKECDRIAACCNELSRLGVQVEEGPDWLRVHPAKQFEKALIETYDDHRVAMAFSLLGLISEGISVKEPACVTKSFPDFWKEMQRFVDFHQSQAVVAQ